MDKIKEVLKKYEVDAILVTNIVNVQYLSHFTGSTGSVLLTKNKKYVLVDPRYSVQAKEQCPDCEVVVYGGSASSKNINQSLEVLFEQEGIKTLGLESDYLSYAKYNGYVKAFPQIENFVEVNIDDLRVIKSSKEITTIKKACKITEQVFDYVVKNIKVGMSEQEVSNMMLSKALELGASGMSFDTIVASGVRSSLPHGVASDKIIEANDMITLDFGVMYKGYASDMTRTICLGSQPDAKHVEIYEIVMDALLKATKSVKPGIKASHVDKVARDYITKHGYGQYFEHGTGHAFGREVHEKPYINPNDQTILEPGMVFTIEPGIYLKDFGGVRIEDDILVTKDGYEVLTHSDRDLIKIEGK